VSVDYTNEWPLDEGEYRGVIGRNADDDGMYYDIFAISDEFVVNRFNVPCGTPETMSAAPTTAAAPITLSPTTLRPSTADPTTLPPTTLRPTTAAPTTLNPTTTNPTTNPTTTQPTTALPTTASPISISSGPHPSMTPIIADAKTDIASLILTQPSLSALFLRMIFNDCIGGCDGCINLSNPDNRMLDVAMDTLAPIVAKYEPHGLSRPDIWVLASFTGVEMAMPQNEFLPIPFNTIGRQPCDAEDMTQGPNPEICSPNMGTNDVLTFFRTQFGFTPRETAAIMGAHTM
jgi:Peroxidase